MSDSLVSRRALFGLGVARLAEGLDDPPALDATQEYGDRLREAWGASRGADLWAPATSTLLDRVPPAPRGARVLDAGTGEGALAVLAAGRGAQVTACDWSPALLERAAEHAAAAGARIELCEADLAALPFADGHFDQVVSSFAPMFCLRARAALAELFRVVRPGGTVAFTAWTGRGIVGRLLRLVAEHDPAPARIPSALTWGRYERLRQALMGLADDPELEDCTLTMRFASHDEAIARLLTAFAPLAAAHARRPLDVELRALVEQLGEERGGAVHLPAGYLLVVATR